MSSFRSWILAFRPKTLPLSLAPVIVGTAVAHKEGNAQLILFLIIALTAVTIQIVTNLTNDVFDFERGVDQERDGPIRVTQAGLLSPKQVKTAIVFSVFFALCFGAWLVLRGGVPIFLIGVFSLVFAVAYSAGPIPLSETPFSEIFIFIFFGPVAVAGTHYLHTLSWSKDAVLIGIPLGLLSASVLMVNNIRDEKNDRAVGRKTIAVLLPRISRKLYAVHLISACVLPLMYYETLEAFLLALLSLIPAVFLIRKIFQASTSLDYNRILAQTGLLAFFWAMLASVWVVF